MSGEQEPTVKEEQEEGRKEDGSGEERARVRSVARIVSMVVLGRTDFRCLSRSEIGHPFF